MCSFFINSFTTSDYNDTMYSVKRTGNSGNRNFHSKLPIIIFFELTQLAWLSQKNLRKPQLI